MKEKPIIRSPYAFDPYKAMLMTEKERDELYSSRADQLVQPYTVIDVLTKVYNRNFTDDLNSFISEHAEILKPVKRSSDDWFLVGYDINSVWCREQGIKRSTLRYWLSRTDELAEGKEIRFARVVTGGDRDDSYSSV